jgi:hypothetical protein
MEHLPHKHYQHRESRESRHSVLNILLVFPCVGLLSVPGWSRVLVAPNVRYERCASIPRSLPADHPPQ